MNNFTAVVASQLRARARANVDLSDFIYKYTYYCQVTPVEVTARP